MLGSLVYVQSQNFWNNSFFLLKKWNFTCWLEVTEIQYPLNRAYWNSNFGSLAGGQKLKKKENFCYFWNEFYPLKMTSKDFKNSFHPDSGRWGGGINSKSHLSHDWSTSLRNTYAKKVGNFIAKQNKLIIRSPIAQKAIFSLFSTYLG